MDESQDNPFDPAPLGPYADRDMDELTTIKNRVSAVRQDFVSGKLDSAVQSYATLVNEHTVALEHLTKTNRSFQEFHRLATLQSVLFGILETQHPRPGQSFTLNLGEFTFGKIGEVAINEIAVAFVEKAEYAEGGNRWNMFKLMQSDFEFHGYTRDTVPLAVLYVINFILRDVLEYLPYFTPGRALVDIGSSIGLPNLFIGQLGFNQIYMIDKNQDALATGRKMAETLGLSEWQYLSPEDWDSIPGDQIDLMQSFRSWCVKYPFEEYEELFLKCLKPGLRVSLDIKQDWIPTDTSLLVAKARDRIQLNTHARAPRSLFIY